MRTYTVTDPADLIGIIPHILGYRPADSLVLVTGTRAAGGRGRVGPTMRFDFDAEAAAGFAVQDLESVVDMFDHVPEASAVFPVLFSCDVAEALGLLGGERCEAAFERFQVPIMLICEALEAEGIDVSAPMWVGAGFCGSLVDPDEVSDRASVEASEAAVRMIVDGSAHAEDFDAVVEPPAADPRLVREISRGREAPADDAQRFDAVVSDVLTMHEARADDADAVMRGLPTSAGVLGVERMCSQLWSRDCLQMMLGFDHPSFRLSMLRQMRPGEFFEHAQREGRSVNAARHMIGLSPQRPDMSRTAVSVAYLSRLAGLVSQRHQPAVYAMLAWFEWSRARNSFAGHYAQRALQLDPDYSLAQLVRRAVDTGLPPQWMR